MAEAKMLEKWKGCLDALTDNPQRQDWTCTMCNKNWAELAFIVKKYKSVFWMWQDKKPVISCAEQGCFEKACSIAGAYYKEFPDEKPK